MKEDKEQKEKLFTKRDYWNMIMYVFIMCGSIFSGISVYMFFVYGYVALFPDYTFFSFVNMGGMFIMFYVVFKMFKFWKYLWNEWRRLFFWSFHEYKVGESDESK